MARISLALSCLIVFVLNPTGDGSAFASAKEDSPHIHFEKREYDFGVAGQQEKITHNFQFANTGRLVLKIVAVKTSCGCVATLLSAREIAPGATGTIRADFQTQKYVGKQTRTIVVHSNDPEEPELELKMTGRIKTDIAIEPEFLYFGDVDKGQVAVKTIRVIQLGDKELSIKRVQATEKYFTTSISRFGDKRHKGFKVHVVLKPDVPAGRFTEVMTLHVNLPKRPKIDVPIYGSVLGRIRVKPQMISLGNIKRGSVVPNKIVVTSADRGEYKISSVTSDLPFLSTQINGTKNKAEFEIALRVDANAPLGRTTGKIQIYTDDPDQISIEVPVYGMIADESVPDSVSKGPLSTADALRDCGHVYISRPPVEVDTYVSAWLIKRFLDPAAEFRFVVAGSPIPEAGGCAFDLPTARARWRRTHKGSTSEHLLTEIKEPNHPTVTIVAMVRKLEMASWLVSPTSDAGRLRASIMKTTHDITDSQVRLSRVFRYLDNVYASGGCVP